MTLPTLLRGAAAVALLGALGGCATSVETCDPNVVNNVLTSAACANDGVYQERQSNLSANYDRIAGAVEDERIAISQANRRIRDAEAAQQITATQARSLSGQVNALNSDVDRYAATGDPAVAQRIEARKAAINAYSDITVF